VSSLMTVKLGRDLRATWPRILMMVIAIAVSLTVCGAVFYSWSAVGRETRAAYLGTEPASATILLNERLDMQRIAAIAAAAAERPGVLEATGRTQFESQIEVNGEPRDVPLQVFAADPDDPMRMAKFDVEQGNWPPSAGEILIGRDNLTLLDVSVGDTVTLQRPNGKPAELRVVGTV
jgi:putative ABC transport system permease protein